jgi:hypothetical protein
MPIAVQLIGELDQERLEDTFWQIIKRHESLRTSFIMLGDEPVQVVHEIEDMEFAIKYYELTLYPGIDEIIRDFISSFNLSRAPVLRVGMVNLDKEKHLLLLDMHHIITDGVSHEILINDLTVLYQGEVLPGFRLQYKDYSEWQKSNRGKEIIMQQEAYWLNQFSNRLPELQMPTDYQRPMVQTFAGDHLRFTLEEKLWQQLVEFAKETGTTLYVILLTAFFVLLHKYTKQEDIVIGSPITGRRHVDLQHIIGMFVNMLTLRARPKENKNFYELLEEVKETALNAFENQDYQFDELVQKLGLQGETRRNPLFDVVFTMQNINPEKNSIDCLTLHSNLKIVPYQYDLHISRFDLNLVAYEGEGSLHMEFEYSTELFKPSTIEELQKHYVEIINQALKNKDLCPREIKLSYDLVKIETFNILEEHGDFEF